MKYHHLVNFYISLQKHENCHISARFDIMLQTGSLKCTGCEKKLILKINFLKTHRVRSKLKVRNSRTFNNPDYIFQATKLSTKKPYPRCRHSKFRLQCDNEEFARVKFKDFSRIFEYFQAPYLFSSTFKGPEVLIPNSSIFKDFSSML